MRSSTRRGAARTRTNGDTDIHRSDNVIDLELHRAQRRPVDDLHCGSEIRIGIGADGNAIYESNIRQEDADRLTDILLLILLKAREARAGLR